MSTLVKWIISDETDWAGPKVTHYLLIRFSTSLKNENFSCAKSFGYG